MEKHTTGRFVINHRITPQCEEDFPRLVKYFTALSCPTFIVRENTNKFGKLVSPHIHLYIEYNKTVSTYRQQFSLGPNAPFKSYKGNGDHSIKPHPPKLEDVSVDDMSRNFQYLCKGWKGEDEVLRAPIVLYNNMDAKTPEVIKEHQDAYWLIHATTVEEHKAMTKDDVLNAENKIAKKKPKPPSWVELTIKEIQTIFAERNEEVHLRDPIHKQIIFMACMSRLKDTFKPFDDQIFMRLFNAVENGLSPKQKMGSVYDGLLLKYPHEFMAHIDYVRFVPETPEIQLKNIRESRNKQRKTKHADST